MWPFLPVFQGSKHSLCLLAAVVQFKLLRVYGFTVNFQSLEWLDQQKEAQFSSRSTEDWQIKSTCNSFIRKKTQTKSPCVVYPSYSRKKHIKFPALTMSETPCICRLQKVVKKWQKKRPENPHTISSSQVLLYHHPFRPSPSVHGDGARSQDAM